MGEHPHKYGFRKCLAHARVLWERQSVICRVVAQVVRWPGIPSDACSSPVAAASLTICSPHLHRAMRGAQGVLPMRVGGATSQLGLPSLTPLSVVGCVVDCNQEFPH